GIRDCHVTGVQTCALPIFALNHLDASTAPSPLNFTAMFWSWQSGYKFLRVDTADDTFRVHLGSTGCSSPGPSRPPTSCSAPNRRSEERRVGKEGRTRGPDD